jgi:hypothetical protein
MTLPANDDFNRSDDSTGLGSSWSVIFNTPAAQVLGSAAAPNIDNQEGGIIWNADTFASNHYSQARISQRGNLSYCGILVRGTSSNYYLFYTDDSDARYFGEIVGGSFTAFATSTPLAVNDVMRLEADGTTIRALINGTLWTSVTDSSHSGGSAGIASYDNITSTRVDDWEGGNLTSDQNITAQLIASGEVIYQATVTPGAVTISANLIASAEQVYQATVTQIQVARPTSTVSAGAWTDQVGGTTDMHSPLADESQSTWIQSELNPAASFVEVALGALTDPGVSTGHVIAYQYDKTPTTSESIDLTVQLRQGASTVIATVTHSDISGTIVDGELTLSGAEADAITDYGDLRLRFIATQV